MRNTPFRSLMSDTACRTEMMSSVGRQLEKLYSPVVSAPMPERMVSLMQRLSSHADSDSRTAEKKS